MDRRSFITLTAISGTTAVLAGCGHPEHQLIRLIPDDDVTPGVAAWKPSVCPLCSAGCGLQVRVMAADVDAVRDGQHGVMTMAVAKKLEGQAAHPINQGALCARGQAAIQITYHPDRLTGPMKRVGPRGSGLFAPASWDEATSTLVQHLDALAAAGNQKALAAMTRPRRSHRQHLFAQFLHAFGSSLPITFELFSDDVLRRANALSFGREQLPTFDLAHSRYVIAFGADFLGTWNSPVAQSVAYGAMRQGRTGVRATFVQVEPRMSLTGANADEWVPATPGTEGVLALGLAHVIIAAKLRSADAAGQAGALMDGWSSGLADYTPEAVERQTGVAAARITRIAHELADSRPSVAIIGGAPLAHTNALFHATAVNALNALLGSVGEAGGVQFTPELPWLAPIAGATAAPSLQKLTADILASAEAPVQVLLVDEVNPIFAAPPAWRVKEALARVPFIVSFGSFIDETSNLADLILPDHSFLESWVDSVPESGASVAVANLAAPVMRPLHDTRATPDVLLDVGRRLQRPVPLPWKTFDEMLKASYATLPATLAGDAWTVAQQQGGWWGTPQPVTRQSPARAAQPMKFAEPRFDGDAGQFPFYFLPYPSQALGDGSVAHLPWLQELPDPLTSAMWSSWMELNPRTAERLGIADGDLVEIRSTHGTVRAPAIISPGIAPDIVAMPVGQGHETFTRYASRRGQNPMGLLAPAIDSETGAWAWAATRVQIARAGGPDGRLMLFAGEMREHPHGQEGR